MSILDNQLAKNSLSNAYIFEGKNDQYTKDFALDFARKVFENYGIDDELSTNPDLYVIDKDVIDIGTIRDMLKNIYLRPNNGKIKIYIIHRANNMRLEGANAMLKSLEDLKDYVMIIFTSKNADQLLPTIRSRCQIISLNYEDESLDIDKESLYRILVDTYRGNIDSFYKNRDFLNSFKEDRNQLIDASLDLFRKLIEKEYGNRANLDANSLYLLDKFGEVSLDSMEKIILMLEDVKRANKVNINFDLAIEHIFFTLFREGKGNDGSRYQI
ncbi:MAG: DNA polymerase III subunit delta [Anaerococcus sp.]|nr:DNA polymerase III subunit delta [Anaerococcus sp.]